MLLWTNGRVTEWLRLVDLAEYAPNLRGSGVHGSLMVTKCCVLTVHIIRVYTCASLAALEDQKHPRQVDLASPVAVLLSRDS